MAIFGSDQIRCSLVQEDNPGKTINYVMNTLDGEEVDEIDIGQKVWPHHWPSNKKYFDWSFIDQTPDMSGKAQLTTFQEAFNSFQKLTKIKLDFQKNTGIKTDLTIEWLENIATFGGKLGVLAHAYLYYPKSKFNGVIEFNDSSESNWYFTALGWPVDAYLVDPTHFTKGQTHRNGNLITRASQPTLQIAMHEIFHSLLGRHDLANPNESLMGPYAKPGYRGGILQKQNFYWDKVSSIPRMTDRFGSSGILNRHLSRWRQRRVLKKLYKRE